ncbi:MAG: extracellular solute-binding protein [Desulfomonilia bacterium]|nr:extracellular solute-binding protein [Desulfomonilia bacterium]
MKKIVAFLVVLLVPGLIFASGKEVYVFNWSEYIDPAVLEQFENETGIEVKYSTFDSNEAMFAKLKITRGGYDVAVPSTYFVDRMRKLDMIEPLDRAKIPNLRYLDPSLLNKPYDPNNVFSVPYMWGSSAIGVNAEKIDPSTITSWNDLWRPEFRGQVLLMDDVREVFAMALRSLGYSGNDTNEEHIRAAYEKLRELRPNIKLFNSDSPRQPFLNNEVSIGQIWGGEVYQANQEMPNLQYIYPREGAIFWVDSMVIPKGAPNRENAHIFINFMLRPEVAKMNSEYVGYATPNLEALSMLEEETRAHKAVYPDKVIVEQGEFQTDVGEAILIYAKYWEMLKTRK